MCVTFYFLKYLHRFFSFGLRASCNFYPVLKSVGTALLSNLKLPVMSEVIFQPNQEGNHKAKNVQFLKEVILFCLVSWKL